MTRARVMAATANRARAALVTMSLGASLSLFASCGADSREATRVELAVVVDARSVEPVTTDLGYEVKLSAARVTIEDLEFTVAGEVHTAQRSLFRELLVSTARAHPGHYQGGEVTGELKGRYVIDWLANDGEELGLATLLAGDYQAINFTFGYATTGEVGEADALLAHTALLEGTASKDGKSQRFRALIDSPKDRQLVGLPFEQEVRAATRSSIGLLLVPRDPYENDTLFDGLDFATLPASDEGIAEISAEAQAEELVAAYELLRRTFQTHDHFDAVFVNAP